MSDEQEQAQKNDVAAADGPVPRLRLRSLKIHEFRDVRPGTELHFGDGFHLVLGKNGSGKSTLLQLLAAVSVLDFRGPFFEGTPFHLEADIEIGALSLHAEIRRAFASNGVSEEADSSLNEQAEILIRIRHPEERGDIWAHARTGEGLRFFLLDPMLGRDEAPYRIGPLPNGPLGVSLNMFLHELRSQFVERPTLSANVRPAWLRVAVQPGTGVVFDESLGVLHIIAGRELTLDRGFPFRYVDRENWLPRSLEFNATGEPVSLPLKNNPLLKDAISQLGFDDAKAHFGPAATIRNGYRYSSPSFQFFHKGKAVRRHDQLSFGQKRLFSFAWYLACNPDIAIADELVNGLHSDWIDWCVQTLSDRQSFLTSQNPILVDSIPFRSADDIRRGIILCETVHNDATGSNELCFRQLDDAETDLLTRAFEQSRLDLLSDLLHALELW